LTLRIGENYVFLHQGACEHFFIVKQIRGVNRKDPLDALVPQQPN
jgi:hypothetical protein